MQVKGLSDESFWLIDKLLNKNAETRLGRNSRDLLLIQGSSFFRGVDWGKLRNKLLPPNLELALDQDLNHLYAQNLNESYDQREIIDDMSGYQPGFESDCSQTSLWLEDFTQEVQTLQNSLSPL